MTDFFNGTLFRKLPEGEGAKVNKKQLQDFIKTVLFEKNGADLQDMIQNDYYGMTGAALAIVQTAVESVKSGDFGKVRPLLDFAFEREGKARK